MGVSLHRNSTLFRRDFGLPEPREPIWKVRREGSPRSRDSDRRGGPLDGCATDPESLAASAAVSAASCGPLRGWRCRRSKRPRRASPKRRSSIEGRSRRRSARSMTSRLCGHKAGLPACLPAQPEGALEGAGGGRPATAPPGASSGERQLRERRAAAGARAAGLTRNWPSAPAPCARLPPGTWAASRPRVCFVCTAGREADTELWFPLRPPPPVAVRFLKLPQEAVRVSRTFA
jgi:hypothetical protein